MRLEVAKTWDGNAARADERAWVELARSASELLVRVHATFHGDPPPEAPPGSTERLWEHEAVEVFLLGRGDEYLEIELGPHGHYLVLRLRGARRVVSSGHPARYTSRIDPAGGEGRPDRGTWTGEAGVAWDLVPAGVSRGNAFAIHGTGADRRYLAAFPVPGDGPDFHRLASFGPLDIR